MNELQGRVRSTLEVVEEFYEEQLSSALYKKIRQTPLEQLSELVDRIATNNEAIVKWALDTSHRPPLFVQDTSYLYGGQNMPLLDLPELKHLILYTERFILPDTTAEIIDVVNFNLQQSGHVSR